MRIPGLRLHNKTDLEVTLICYQLAAEAIEEELRRDALAESHPLNACGAAHPSGSFQPHEAAINQITQQLIRMGAK